MSVDVHITKQKTWVVFGRQERRRLSCHGAAGKMDKRVSGADSKVSQRGVCILEICSREHVSISSTGSRETFFDRPCLLSQSSRT